MDFTSPRAVLTPRNLGVREIVLHVSKRHCAVTDTFSQSVKTLETERVSLEILLR